MHAQQHGEAQDCFRPTLSQQPVVQRRQQIVLAVLVFHDKVTWFNVLGLGLAILGSMLYKITRAKPSARNGEGGGGKDER